MKIMHIITRLDKGGSSENVLHSCEFFALKKPPIKNKYEVALVYGGNTFLKEHTKDLNIKIYYIKELQRNVDFIRDFVAFIKIFNIINKEKPDIVHTHSSKAGILGRWGVFLINLKLKIKNDKLIKVVHTPHGHIFYGYYNRFITYLFVLIEKITARITDKLIALTEGEKEETLSFGVGKPQQWSVIHSGVNLVDFKTSCFQLKYDLFISESDIVVGTVARLEPVKGVGYLIGSIPFLEKFLTSSSFQPITFLIVGNGSQRKILEKKLISYNFKYFEHNSYKIFEKSIDNKKFRVIFTGIRDDVCELISVMDIYVQPSVNEGMGKTIILAQLLGKPVIATRVQGIPSIVLDGQTGILIEPKNSKMLAEAIISLLKDKELREKISSNAKIFSSKKIDGYPRFSVERMVYLLETLYMELK